MTSTSEYELKCANCKTNFKVELYDTVNLDLQPELIDLFWYKKFNGAECPKCHAFAYIDKWFIFNDKKLGIWQVKEGQALSFWYLLNGEGYFDKFKTKNPFLRLWWKVKRKIHRVGVKRPWNKGTVKVLGGEK